MTLYKISPSDLTFAWDGCKYCFYLKVKHNIVMRGIFPGIFTKMSNLTSEYYQNRTAHEISIDLPAGVVKYREKFVKSIPISFANTTSQCYINGRFDAVIEFEDGSFGIVDYKTSDAKEEQAAFYSRQLSAYAYALEHPAPNSLGLSPISKLGLFIITRHRFERTATHEMAFVNRATWMDVARDDGAFLELLREVVTLLDNPNPPEPSEDCEACKYRNSVQELERKLL